MPEVQGTAQIDDNGDSLKLNFERVGNKYFVSWSVSDPYKNFIVERGIKEGNSISWTQEREENVDVYSDSSFTLKESEFTRVKLVTVNVDNTEELKSSGYFEFNPINPIIEENLTPPEVNKVSTNFFDELYGTDYGLSISRVSGKFNVVKGTIKLKKPAGFNFSQIKNINLQYKTDGSSRWQANEMQIPSNYEEDSDSYSIKFENQVIDVNSQGITVYFKASLIIDGYDGEQETALEFLFFDALSPVPSLLRSNSSLSLDPKPIDQANLKYEIKTIISEGYFVNEYPPGHLDDLPETDLYHFFLDETKVKNIKYSDQTFSVFRDQPTSKGFIYQSESDSETDNLEGFFYPACVSEILPCISLIESDNTSSKQIKLSWKIIDNFFDYTFYFNALRVVTDYLKVDVQYKVNNNYETVKSGVVLTKENSYSSNFFVITLKASESLPHFSEIKVSDNQTDNLRILISEHKVTCSSPVRSDGYTFTKMLLPPSWSYIVYDRFVGSADRKSDNTIDISLDKKYLRGIKLPERGFKTFDVVQDWKEFDKNGSSYTRTTKILFKLKSSAFANYLDPIREGTVTYVQLPSSGLDDVFVVPPTLTIGKPNIDPEGKQATGEVVLDQYGKISGIRILDPGYGYSMFKTEELKRTQTFVDFIPVVRSRYHISSTNQGVSKTELVPQNESFARLKASISGGALLNQAGLNNGAGLDEVSKNLLDEYLKRTGQEDNVDQISNTAPSTKNYYDSGPNASSNSVTIEKLDLEWYNISQLYSDKTSNPIDEFSIYNIDTDVNVESVADSSVSENISSSQSSLDIAVASPTEKTEGYSLNDLPVYTDASAAISVFNPGAAPPNLTLLPIDQRPEGSAAYGALPNMLTRADSFFNRLVDGINNLNKVRLIAPTVWGVNLKEVRTSWYTDSSGDSLENISFSRTGISITNTREEGYTIPSNGRGFGARVERSVRKRDLSLDQNNTFAQYGLSGVKIESTELNQSMNIQPLVHPWLQDAVPSFLQDSFSKNYLAYETRRVEICNSFLPYQENGFGILNGCGTSIQIQPNISVPDGKIVETLSGIKFFNGGTISLANYGEAKALTFPSKNGGFCNTFSCASISDVELDFKYSNLYPMIASL